MEGETHTAAPQQRADKKINIFNDILKLASLSCQAVDSLSRSHTEESLKIYTCLVFILRKV